MKTMDFMKDNCEICIYQSKFQSIYKWTFILSCLTSPTSSILCYSPASPEYPPNTPNYYSATVCMYVPEKVLVQLLNFLYVLHNYVTYICVGFVTHSLNNSLTESLWQKVQMLLLGSWNLNLKVQYWILVDFDNF